MDDKKINQVGSLEKIKSESKLLRYFKKKPKKATHNYKCPSCGQHRFKTVIKNSVYECRACGQRIEKPTMRKNRRLKKL